ncbi:MAG: AraC family transcriptional regulator ligand-binding domain-containing protein [Caulobacterales bacterium]
MFGPFVVSDQPEAYVSYDDLWRVSNRHIHSTGDEAHALGRAAVPVGTFELLAATLHQAESMGEGLERVAKASMLVTAALDISLRREGGVSTLYIDAPQLSEPRRSLYIALWVIVFHCLLRWLTRRDLLPSHVAPPLGASQRTEEMLRLLQCKVAVGKARFALSYSRKDCAAPLLPFDLRPWEAEVFLVYRRLVAQALANEDTAGAQGLTARVRLELLSGASRQSDVCRTLGLSPATLRRRLAEEGACFRDLLDAHRRDYFERLASSGGNQDQIAASIGYSDSRSLRRARDRWGR